MESEQTARLLEEVKALTAKNLELQKELATSENLLEFERNKYENLLRTQEADIAERISSGISLELQAIRDLVCYLEEDDRRRFNRRLARIDRYLSEFGG